MKIHYSASSLTLSAVLTLALVTASCSSGPAHKAASVIDKLGDDAKVLSFNPKGNEPYMIVAQHDDTAHAVIKYNLADNSCDTVATGLKSTPLAVRQGKESYLVVSSAPDPLNEGRECALVAFYKKGEPGTELSRVEISNEDNGTVTLPSSFIINDEAQQIAVTGVSVNNADVTNIYVTFDFDGRQIDDRCISIKRPDPALVRSQQGVAMYLWQCEKCGRRVNKSKNPGQDLISGCWHNWVNLGRVD